MNQRNHDDVVAPEFQEAAATDERSLVARVASRSVSILSWVLVWFGLTLLSAGLTIRATWGIITVDQMMTNLAGAAGEGGGGMFWLTFWWIGIFPALLTLGLFFARKYLLKRLPERYRPSRDRFRTLTQRYAVPVMGAVLVFGVAATGSTSFSTAVNLPTYVRSVNSAFDIADFYKAPEVTNADDLHNVVVIYVESAEQTLTDEDLFEINMLRNLEDATEDWAKMDNYYQYEGGGWTMAGITSSQCGVPLRGKTANTGLSAMNKLDVDDFMPGVTCFGDVLSEHGFNNVYLGGSSASFASKGDFLKTHGYDTVKDLEYWKYAGEQEADIRPDWGLSDERLMEHAKETVDELYADYQQTGQKFNLSMLTLDSHEPIHLYDTCERTTDDELASIWDCSANAVQGFIDHMDRQGYLEDTAVIVQGDHLKHLAAKNVYHEQLDFHPNRTIFNRFWIPGTENGVTPLGELRDIDQLSMYPTMLEAVGFELEGREAGLGVSAFADVDEIPLDSAQHLDEDDWMELMNARSSFFYDHVWSQTPEEFARAVAEAEAAAAAEEATDEATAPEEDR